MAVLLGVVVLLGAVAGLAAWKWHREAIADEPPKAASLTESLDVSAELVDFTAGPAFTAPAFRSVSLRGGELLGTQTMKPLWAQQIAQNVPGLAAAGVDAPMQTLALAALCGAAAALAGVGRTRSRQGYISRRATGPAASQAPPKPILRLGTRGSPLARCQAAETKRRLGEAFPELAQPGAVEVVVISTTGDERLDISLADIGGKGLFTKELDVALLAQEVDLCVHSTKDVPTKLPAGTELCAMLPREDSRDVLISGIEGVTRIQDFPKGSVIGTASLRRQAQIYAKNPGVKCVNFRGNVQTRLKKLKAGEVHATMLAYAGLRRMGMEENATSILPWEEMLPAIAQGAISFQCRSDDTRTKAYLQRIACETTMRAVICERAFLAALDGNCKTPIAGQARILPSGRLHFQGLVQSPNGDRTFTVEREGEANDDAAAAALGHAAGMEVRKEAGEKFFEDMQAYVQDMVAANTRPTGKK